MKRNLSVILLVLMTLMSYISVSIAETGAGENEVLICGDYYYTLTDEGVIILDWTGNDAELTIPSELDGQRVVAIGEGAFANCHELEEITIPDTVTYIGEVAFSVCRALKKVTIPASVTEINGNVFSFCDELEEIYVSPDNPAYAVMDGVLFDKRTKTLVCYPYAFNATAYTVPEGILGIGERAFASCVSLESITLPDTLVAIDYWAFYNCTALESITIPDSVTEIGVDPFSSCARLESIYVSPDSPAYASVNGVLFDKRTKALVNYPCGLNATAYTVPDGIIIIASGAFSGCETMEEITLPTSLTTIGEGAFIGCRAIKELTLPDSITSIGEMAFCNCSALKKFTIPVGLSTISNSMLSGCTELQMVTVPDGITSIDSNAFEECSALEEITIPSSVTIIGDGAFAECTALKMITIPDSITSIGNMAFSQCVALKEVVIPESVISIGDGAFADCAELKSVTLPAYIDGFDLDNAFGGFTYDSMTYEPIVSTDYRSRITFTVPRDSEMARLCKETEVNYTYSDANDWLNG